jgi:plastocyanin
MSTRASYDRHFLSTVAAVAAALLLNACGGAGGSSVAPPVSGGSTTQTVARGANATRNTTGFFQHSSGPRTWFVTAGAQSRDGADLALAYYANSITIDAGDSVTWTQSGGNGNTNIEPHTVSFLEGSTLTAGVGPLAIPKVAFWSSEQCGNTPTPCSGTQNEDGSSFNSSPLMYTGGQTYTLTFTKSGTYVYYCLIHYPEMEGVVKVQPFGSPYPKSQLQYDIAGTIQSNEDLLRAALSTLQFPFRPGGTTLAASISPGLSKASKPSDLVVVRFLDSPNARDSNVTIHVGQTITWVNEDANDPHTVSFAVGGVVDPASALAYCDPFCPAMGGTTYDGTQLVNSGMMLPGKSYSLTFTAKGKFTYYCLFHDILGMIGTVTVD